MLANFETIEREPNITAAFADALSLIEASGADIQTLDLAGFDPAATRRAGLLICEAEAGHCQRNVGVPTNLGRLWFQAAI